MPLLDLQGMAANDEDDPCIKASRWSVTACRGISHLSVTLCRP